MADNRAAQMEEIDELCDDLVEHLEQKEQGAAIAAAEMILQKVRQYFGVTA